MIILLGTKRTPFPSVYYFNKFSKSNKGAMQ
jgi:hypothetical protein